MQAGIALCAIKKVIIGLAHKGDYGFLMYKEKIIGMDFKWNALKVGNVSAVCLETMLNYKCSQLLFLGWRKQKTLNH